ncbi:MULTISPECIES: DUF1127 domain-containing protein [unclassified Meridianimarinicoccus]|uniref:DUF1127 domain-containing protein n=1 Tax=unclassified Meridianimarinicoccus TaxID=2923344 RepID=UPI001868E9D4|nr:DUF1127 domain-containing protein [Fluviibacterium sp. MJW13]
MATTTANGIGHVRARSTPSLWTRLVHGLLTIADNNEYLGQVRRLQAMSDNQLAKRGLTRDKIVDHVFRYGYFN